MIQGNGITYIDWNLAKYTNEVLLDSIIPRCGVNCCFSLMFNLKNVTLAIHLNL